MWLPGRDKWNGRFLGTGNGIFGGTTRYDALVPNLSRGYAVINTDQGIRGRNCRPPAD